MPSIGPLELIIILAIIVIIFGVGKLPEIGGALGRGIKEFRNSVQGGVDEDEKAEKPAAKEPSEKV